jgi:hypothetical protein
MKMMLAGIALAGMMVAFAAWAEGNPARGEGAAQGTVSIGVDADPTGNTATSLGPIDSCVSVSSGETFQVDIFVTDVVDLLAWETYFSYDMAVVKITDRDVMMFQAANPDSQVFDVSEGLPDIDGRYRIAAADISEPPAPDSGSGVLARLTLEAVGSGVSPASLSPVDVNGDGKIDYGPFLRDAQGESVGDADGDGFFDGPIVNAEIAVDMACPGGTPVASPTATTVSPSQTPSASPTHATTPTDTETPTATPSMASPTPTATAASPTPGGPAATDDEGSAWTGVPAIIGYVLGGLAVVLVAGAALVVGRGRRAG